MFLNHDAKIRLFHETTKLFLLNSVKILILIFLTNRPFVPRETITLPPFHVKHYFYESLTVLKCVKVGTARLRQKACQSVL